MSSWLRRAVICVLATIAAVIPVAVVLGMRLPQHHHAQATALISAPPLAVWTMISDVSAEPEWRSGVRRVEVLGDGRWREYGPGGGLTYRLDSSEFMGSRVVVIDDKDASFTGTWRFTLTPVAGGRTQLKIEEDASVSNPVWRFVGHYLIGERSTMDSYLRDLQRAFKYKKQG